MGTTLVHSNLFSYYLFLHRSPFRSAPRDNDGYTSILSQFQLCLWQRWEHCNFSRYSLFPRRSTPLRVPIPFRSVCACNDIENLFLFNSISISSSRSAPFRSVQSERSVSVSFCFVLFRSVSFCFIPIHSIPFHSIPFPIPFRSVQRWICPCVFVLICSISICFNLFQSVSFCFVLFHSVSFCLVLFRSVLFCFIPFHSPFRACNDIENLLFWFCSDLFHFNPFQSISFCFILFRSVSFCFILFRSVSFCFVLFPVPTEQSGTLQFL